MAALRVSRMILEKVRSNAEVMKEILDTKCSQELSALDHAIASTNKNNEKCAKIIMSYFDEDSDVPLNITSSATLVLQ